MFKKYVPLTKYVAYARGIHLGFPNSHYNPRKKEYKQSYINQKLE